MISKIINEIEQSGFCYIQDFLDAEKITSINEYFDENRSEFKAALIGPKDNRQRMESIRGDYTHWIDPLAPAAPFLYIIETLSEIKNALNSRFYLGLNQFECHLAYYPPGSFYKRHLDRFETNSSRKLSFVFYLNPDWQETDGGELVLFDKNNNVVKTIFPKPGSFVCFLSEDFPHEVKIAMKERRSLTGWMHTKIIY